MRKINNLLRQQASKQRGSSSGVAEQCKSVLVSVIQFVC